MRLLRLARLSLLTIFWVSCFSSAEFACLAQADSRCHDFLADLRKKPKQLEFQSCEQRTDLQSAPFEARYRVAGIHATQVESYLSRELKVKKLQHDCCLWESNENSYRDQSGRLFMISMATEETVVSSRSQWTKIPYFYVLVSWYQEEP